MKYIFVFSVFSSKVKINKFIKLRIINKDKLPLIIIDVMIILS